MASEADIYGGVSVDQGLYLKIKDGETVRLRIFSNAASALIYQKAFKKGDKVDLTTRFSYVVYNIASKRAQIWEVSPTVYGDIKKFILNPEYGDITRYDISVEREGEGLQTKYSLVAGRNNYELPADAVEDCEKIDLKREVGKGSDIQWLMTLKEYHEAKQKKTADLPVTADSNTTDYSGNSETPVNLDEIPF